MNKLLFFIPMFVLISCKGDDRANEVDIDDFMGETGIEESVDTLDNQLVQNFDTPLQELSVILGSAYDTASLSQGHPLDRFGYSTKQKIEFLGKTEVDYGTNKVVPSAEFFYYSFVDSNKTINAFYNYLDRISEEGEGGPVHLNEDVESIKMAPMFMVVYDTIIISAQYQCEHKSNDWESFQDSVLQVYGPAYKYQINVDCGGPLKWK